MTEEPVRPSMTIYCDLMIEILDLAISKLQGAEDRMVSKYEAQHYTDEDRKSIRNSIQNLESIRMYAEEIIISEVGG